ncbi:MAG TPA: ATP-binding protein [Acidobacteriota bacterium]|nr:ATP-binding protein [Acidobacteriota bacterium]
MSFIRSIKAKLLLRVLPLCLGPLLVISVYSYYLAKDQITEDRVKLYLEEIAQGVADSIHRMLLETYEDVLALSFHQEFRGVLRGQPDQAEAQRLLDSMVLIYKIFDLIILYDEEGRIVLVSQVDRRKLSEIPEELSLPLDKVQALRGRSLAQYQGGEWLRRVLDLQYFAFLDWHSSALVQRVYPYDDEDIALQYNLGFASPVVDLETGESLGGVLALMNWQFVQSDILDDIERRLDTQDLQTGYAFMFGRDSDTIIGHKYRANRRHRSGQGQMVEQSPNNYGKRLVEDLGLHDLQAAVARRDASFQYQYPVGTDKISGLAEVDAENRLADIFGERLGWVCGVGIDNDEIFGTVYDLRKAIIFVALFSAVLVVFLVFSTAESISVPLRELRIGAARISGGDFSERVSAKGADEIAELASTFNEMAASLEERSRALLELNRNLEEKVQERTRELEERNTEVKKAYRELQETQVQLIQSEKMASLGQLVAGIAHEIKNPLNFIYGNTDFLKQYVGDLKRLIGQLEEILPDSEEAQTRVDALKDQINYQFLSEDLDTLIANFEEGAKRIHAIIGDLRTFSRLDTDQLRSVDIREPIDLALNLLRNQYRDRIRIHKEFADLPLVECDPGKISQVVMNLLVNACHAIPEQGDIWVRTARRDGSALIEIEDNGKGIDQEHLNKVFEPFFTTKPVGKGTGLGLSISYGIIQQHKGKIEVESRPGKGTRFRVELPFKS